MVSPYGHGCHWRRSVEVRATTGRRRQCCEYEPPRGGRRSVRAGERLPKNRPRASHCRTSIKLCIARRACLYAWLQTIHFLLPVGNKDERTPLSFHLLSLVQATVRVETGACWDAALCTQLLQFVMQLYVDCRTSCCEIRASD